MDESMNNWLALLVAIPMLAAIATTLLRPRIASQRVAGVVALGALVAMNAGLCWSLPSGTNLFMSMLGAWPAPFGIAAVYDGLSGALLLVTSVVGLSCYLACFSLLPRRMESGWFHPLYHLLIMGVNFSFLTGDLFNLFVAFEIMLMASYALLTLGSTRAQLSQAYKYVVLNLLGSTVFVLSAGLVYGMMGTLNYADLARLVAEAHATGEALPAGFQSVSVLLLFVFALKAAVFPLWFWLPDTYHTMPAPIAGAFAALLSKVGVYAILRLYPMAFGSPLLEGSPASSVILPLAAGFTMVIAIVGAIGATTMRRILAMVLMAHVGYLLFGVALMTGPAHAATCGTWRRRCW
jgi:multicomponent Na+:H+ antiporter subunit D